MLLCRSDVGVGQGLRLRRQPGRAVGVRDGLAQVGVALVLRRLQQAHRLGQPGPRLGADGTAAGVDVVRHPADPRLGVEQRLVERAAETLGRLTLLRDLL